MRVRVYRDNIIHLRFATQKDLTLTMCRAQEFYECNSTKLRKQVFSFEQFLDHYVDRDGHMTYFNFWSGFNIPGPVLENFFAKFDLGERERKLRRVTRKHKQDLYYVIATLKDDRVTFRHEMVHAMYYMDPEYKQSVDVLIRHMRKRVKEEVTEELRNMGYTSQVINDEINAYLSTSRHKYLVEEFSSSLKPEDVKPFVDLAKKAGLV